MSLDIVNSDKRQAGPGQRARLVARTAATDRCETACRHQPGS